MSGCSEKWSFLENVPSDDLQAIDLPRWRICLQPGWKYHGRAIIVYKEPCNELKAEAKEELAAVISKLTAVYQELFQTRQYSYQIHSYRDGLSISISPKPQGAVVHSGKESNVEVWKIYRDFLLTAWMMAAVHMRARL